MTTEHLDHKPNTWIMCFEKFSEKLKKYSPLKSKSSIYWKNELKKKRWKFV